MSGQLWGTCPWCQRRKRITKVEGWLYAHDRHDGNVPCLGSHMDPKEGSVRTADKVSLTKTVEPIPISLGAIKVDWTRGKTNAEIVEELRELISRGPEPACPRPDPTIVETYTNSELIGSDPVPFDGFWDRYYWCVIGTGLMLLLGVGAFAAGVVWGRR